MDVLSRDIELEYRFCNSQVVDMGAYESHAPWPCTDVTGNGIMNIEDLLMVIAGWGPCPSLPGTCPGDITPTDCGDAIVGIADLLHVIANWGRNCITGQIDDVGSIESVQDCMDAATLNGQTPYSQDWNEFVTKCVDGLCAAGRIPCN